MDVIGITASPVYRRVEGDTYSALSGRVADNALLFVSSGLVDGVADVMPIEVLLAMALEVSSSSVQFIAVVGSSYIVLDVGNVEGETLS